eukprot:746180_1
MMAHKSNQDAIEGWDEINVVQYIQYLFRKQHLKNETVMEDMLDQIEEEEINGQSLWSFTKSTLLKKKLEGAKFQKQFKECRAIFIHLNKLKNGTLNAPCEFQLEYVPIVDWEPETLQQYIASIDPNGKYYQYMPNFKNVSGDMLLHKIQNQSMAVLSKDPFCIDHYGDRLAIWTAIQSISTEGNTATPDPRDVDTAFEAVKRKVINDVVLEPMHSISDDDGTKEDSLDINVDTFKDKDPNKWSIDQAVAWLCSLEDGEYAIYKHQFINNHCSGVCFKHFDESVLIDYGIKSIGHRRDILKAVRLLLRVDDGTTTIHANSHITIKNGLTICLAIGEYNDPKMNLGSVSNDVAYYRHVLAAKYRYKLMSSVDMKGNEGYKMMKKDVIKYINEECIPELLGGSDGVDAELQYDALLIALSGHGTMNSIICSDNERIAYATIREWFQSRDIFTKIPRFFCVDACRVRDKKDKHEATQEEKENASKDPVPTDPSNATQEETKYDDCGSPPTDPPQPTQEEEPAKGSAPTEKDVDDVSVLTTPKTTHEEMYDDDVSLPKATPKAIREVKQFADDDSGEHERGSESAPTATVMGTTEGHTVKGGKVAKYLCSEWAKQFKENEFDHSAFKPFGILLDAAAAQVKNDTKDDKYPQTLMGNEYDRRIDKVVFIPKQRDRSVDALDGTVQSIDDDLRNILLPQANGPPGAVPEKNLMIYFIELFNAGVRTNAELKKLEERLKNDLKIDMLQKRVFDKKELLRRVNALN